MAKPPDSERRALTPYDIILSRAIEIVVYSLGAFMVVWALRHAVEHSSPWDLALAAMGGVMIYLNSQTA